jgi:hypothetical protein
MTTSTDPKGPDLAPLVAEFYAEAPANVRVNLLRELLRPVGPLALVVIAAGAFSRLLPSARWQSAEVTPELAQGIGAEQVLDLALYVQQKSPELLTRLPDLVGSPQVWMASVSGALLLMTLRAWRRRGDGAS